MLEVAVAAALAALIARVVTGAMVPFAAKIAFAVRAVDYPSGRKFHGGAVPRLGGVAIGRAIWHAIFLHRAQVDKIYGPHSSWFGYLRRQAFRPKELLMQAARSFVCHAFVQSHRKA